MCQPTATTDRERLEAERRALLMQAKGHEITSHGHKITADGLRQAAAEIEKRLGLDKRAEKALK